MGKQKVSVGVVGCGYWGPNHARNLNGLSDCTLRAVCDQDPQRLAHLKSLYPQVECYTSYDEMLERAHLDAVVIATGVKSHFALSQKSLMAGLHTLIEKPMASSSVECDTLIELAARKSLVLMVGHTFLYSAHVRKIKELVESGDLGDIQYISSRRLNLGLFQKDINVAWDLAPHDLSIILYILGEMPLVVNCCGKAHVSRGVEDVTSMCLVFKKNRMATVHNSWLDPRKVREMTLVGSRRMVVYDDVAPLEKIKIYDSRVETPPHYDTFAEFQYAYHYGDMYVPYVRQEEPLKIECQHFLECIREGNRPLSDGVQGRQLVRVLEAASASLRRGGAAVSLAEPKERQPVTPVNGSGSTVHEEILAK
jgi:predicted dehydrogenase